MACRLLLGSPVVTLARSPDPLFPWHLLAFQAEMPVDWVDHSRGVAAGLGQGARGSDPGLARNRFADRDLAGAHERLASGLAGFASPARS